MSERLEARSWIVDRLAAYFHAVDAQDAPAALAALMNASVVHRGVVLSPGERLAFYEGAFTSGSRTAHIPGGLHVEGDHGSYVYRGTYQRFEFDDEKPRLDRIGWCEGRFSFAAGEGAWTSHRVGTMPRER